MRGLCDFLTLCGIIAIFTLTVAYYGHNNHKPLASDVWCSIFGDYDESCADFRAGSDRSRAPSEGNFQDVAGR